MLFLTGALMRVNLIRSRSITSNSAGCSSITSNSAGCSSITSNWIRLNVILCLFCSLVLSTSAYSGAADDPFALGVQLYNAREYRSACKDFALALQKQPRNVSACLYLANSYYQLGQNKAAAQYYQWIVANFANTKEAQAAKVALLHMDVTAINSSRSGKDVTTQAAVASAYSKGHFNVDSMFRVVKPLGDHTPCTQAFIAKMKAAINECPAGVVAYVASKGCKICLTPTLIDRNPELRNSKPRGYEEGHSYKNTPAMFSFPEVVVCQYCIIGDDDGNWQPIDDSTGALRHEFGHAIDAYLGYLSYKEEFRHIYYLDLGGLDPEAKETLAYYVQAGTESGGPSECFAQACCILFGGSTSKGRMDRDVVFKQKFGGVLKYVKNKLESVKGV